MKDLNFFEAYVEKKEFKLNKSMVFYSLIVAICIGFISYAAINGVRIMRLNSQVKALETIAREPKVLEKVSMINEKQAEMDLFKEELRNIEYMDKIIESKEIITEDLIRNITYNLPKESYLTSITINEGSISILGFSNDKWSIAEFARGLGSIKELDEIYISSISPIEDRFSFIIDMNYNKDFSSEEEDRDGEEET